MNTCELAEAQHPSREAVLDGFGNLGNDERKLEIVLAFRRASIPLSRSTLGYELSDISGENLSPYRDSSQSMVNRGILESGAVEPAMAECASTNSHELTTMVPGHVITPEGKTFWFAFAGALLAWSWDHPETSLKHILGGSTGPSGKIPGPLLKYLILKDLGDLPKGESKSIDQSLEDVDTAIGDKKGAVERLTSSGIIDKHIGKGTNTREFEIIDPDYSSGPGRRQFELLSPTTKLIYNTLPAADIAKKVWTIDDFLTFMEALHPNTSPEDIRMARERLKGVFSPSRQDFRHSLVDAGGKKPGLTSQIRLDDEFRPAVSGLVDVVEAFADREPSAIKKGTQQARTIMGNPEVFAALYFKARENSLRANMDPKIEDKLVSIIEALGNTATAKTVRQEYADQSGRDISRCTVYTYLAGLIEAGKVVARQTIVSSRNHAQVAVYEAV